MKKIFYLIAISVLFVFNAAGQEYLVKNDPIVTKVPKSENLNRAVFDYSAVEQIREHIIGDKELSRNLDLMAPVPQMKLAVRVNAKGIITNVEIIEGGSGEHAYYLKKSMNTLKQVTPIKIEGIDVSQKVIIPVIFK